MFDKDADDSGAPPALPGNSLASMSYFIVLCKFMLLTKSLSAPFPLTAMRWYGLRSSRVIRAEDRNMFGERALPLLLLPLLWGDGE